MGGCNSQQDAFLNLAKGRCIPVGPPSRGARPPRLVLSKFARTCLVLALSVLGGTVFSAEESASSVLPVLPQLLSTDSGMGIAVIAEEGRRSAVIRGEASMTGHWRIEGIGRESIVIATTREPSARVRVYLHGDPREPVVFHATVPSSFTAEALVIREHRSVVAPSSTQVDAN